MIESLSRKTSMTIKRWDSDITTSVDVLSYYIGYYINFLSIVLIPLIIGLFTQELAGTAIAIGGFALLRRYSGGFHLPLTPCAILCISMFSIFPHIAISQNTVIIVNVVALLIVGCFANNRPIAIIIVLTNFLFMSEPLALTFIAQALTLIKYRGGDNNEKANR